LRIDIAECGIKTISYSDEFRWRHNQMFTEVSHLLRRRQPFAEQKREKHWHAKKFLKLFINFFGNSQSARQQRAII